MDTRKWQLEGSRRYGWGSVLQQREREREREREALLATRDEPWKALTGRYYCDSRTKRGKKRVTANHFNPKVFHPVFTVSFWPPLVLLVADFIRRRCSEQLVFRKSRNRERARVIFRNVPFFSFSLVAICLLEKNANIFVWRKKQVVSFSISMRFRCHVCTKRSTFIVFCEENRYVSMISREKQHISFVTKEKIMLAQLTLNSDVVRIWFSSNRNTYPCTSN